jgi:hypothetical protein
MKRLVLIFAVAVSAGCSGGDEIPGKGTEGGGGNVEITIDNSARQLIITEQASSSIYIYDQPSRKLLWEWSATDSDIPSGHLSWFRLPDEARPVYNRTCLMITSSGGGAALIRIKDKKALFYACPGGNPHSAEILPDGNMVVASSDGYLTVYKVDTVGVYASGYLSRTSLTAAHNAVWDLNRNCLWSAGGEDICRYDYAEGRLTLTKTKSMPAGCGMAHDLIPIFGSDRMYVTTGARCFIYNPSDDTIVEAPSFQQRDLKSISTGPFGFTTICTRPTESWWAHDVVTLSSGTQIFHMADYQIYKARWRVEAPFSYPKIHKIQ